LYSHRSWTERPEVTKKKNLNPGYIIYSIDRMFGKQKQGEEKEKTDLETIKELTEPPEKELTLPEKQLKPVEPVVKKPRKVPTGIPGLDDLLEGGFIPNSIVMVSGETGSGKTIFCTQFIWNALCLGENGVYVTLQQSPEEIKNDVDTFGRDFDIAEKKNQVRVVYADPQDLKGFIKLILNNVKDIKAKRLVIDSISLIGEQVKEVRKALTYLIRELKKLGVTTLMTSEIPEGTNKLSRFGIEEFIVDGVIVLQYMKYAAGNVPRSLFIKKMRRTRHGMDIYPFEITDKGIVVKKT